MKKYIFILLSVIFPALFIGCGDNVDGVYKPYGNELELSVVPSGQGFRVGDDNNEKKILDLSSENSQYAINVKSNTQWKVTVECSEGWCTSSVYKGVKDGDFDVEVAQNRVGVERSCTVTINTIDAEGNIVEPKDGGRVFQFDVVQSSGDLYITPSEVDPYPAVNPSDTQFRIESKEKDTKWTLTVSYEASQTESFMTVTSDELSGNPDSNGLSVTYSGKGSASFTLGLGPNRSSAQRVGFLTLNSDIGNSTVKITQLGTEYHFNVTAVNPGKIVGSGGEIRYEIYAPAIGWKIEGIPSWIEFSDTTGGNTNDITTVTAKIQPNPSTSDRKNPALISFVPTGDSSGSYTSYATQIAQSGLVFRCDNSGIQESIVKEGDKRTIRFETDLNWKLEGECLNDWVKADKNSGTSSDNSITLTFSPYDGYTRNGSIRIVPQTTQFGDYGRLTTDELKNITPIEFNFTQFGGKEVTVSAPWPSNVEKTSVTLDFNYYSPAVKILGGGIRWRKSGTAEECTETAGDKKESDDDSGYFTVKIADLAEATKYDARAYVVVSGSDSSDSKRIDGDTIITFTTAGSTGARPGGNDNQNPEIDQ